MVLFCWLPQETQECMIKNVFKSCQAFPPPVKNPLAKNPYSICPSPIQVSNNVTGFVF